MGSNEINSQWKTRWLISCDESGIHGAPYYGFGTFWMRWQRRGDFARDIREIKGRHSYGGEIKWNKANHKRFLRFHFELIEYFFKKPWLYFHCIIVRKGVVKLELHQNDWDLARRKHFTTLLTNKMSSVCQRNPDRDIEFRIYVDPIASRYDKADESIEVISNNILNRDLLTKMYPVESVITRDSKETPTIQICDFLLGAVMAPWQQQADSSAKKQIQEYIAEHLGWSDLRSDTRPSEQKFNIWYFHDVANTFREVHTRNVNLKYKLPLESMSGGRT